MNLLNCCKKSPYSGAHPEVFQSMGGFVELGHFDKHFGENSRYS